MLKWFSGEEGEPGSGVSTHVLVSHSSKAQ